MSSTSGAGMGRQRGFAGVAALAAGVGLFALIGLRVKETMADRKAQASALAERVQAAPGKAGATIVHGVARTWRPTIPVTGTLAPVQDAEIGFKMGGRLVSVRVKVGDRVRAGQQLAALDVSEASAAGRRHRRRRARGAGLATTWPRTPRSARSRSSSSTPSATPRASARRTARRWRSPSSSRRARRRSSPPWAWATAASARPSPALVTRAPSGVGKIVGPGEALFHLEDTSVLKLTATLSEGDARLSRSAPPSRVDAVSAEAAPLEATGAAGGHDGVRGKITAVLASLDPQTRRVPVLAEIPNDPARAAARGGLRPRHGDLQQGGPRPRAAPGRAPPRLPGRGGHPAWAARRTSSASPSPRARAAHPRAQRRHRRGRRRAQPEPRGPRRRRPQRSLIRRRERAHEHLRDRHQAPGVHRHGDGGPPGPRRRRALAARHRSLPRRLVPDRLGEHRLPRRQPGRGGEPRLQAARGRGRLAQRPRPRRHATRARGCRRRSSSSSWASTSRRAPRWCASAWRRRASSSRRRSRSRR